MRRMLGHCLGVFLALDASAAAGSAPRGQEPRAPVSRALLVGIEHYPPEAHWPALDGPSPDVAAMHDALVARFGFRSADVEELHDEAATHRGIAAAFERLVDRSEAGDLILFYFAGRGSRLPDDDTDAGSDGWDETLVPYDAWAAPGHDDDIRDDEIARWIARANLKTEQVVLVFDCSSSGPDVQDEALGRARYLSPEARGAAPIGLLPPDAGAARGSVPAGTAAPPFAPRSGSGWVPPRARCVALSACRAQECAYELRVEATPLRSDSGPAKGAAGLYRGSFTMSLIEALASIDSDASWSDLMLRVSARMAAKTPRQTPVIEGALAGYALFRSVASPGAPRFEAEISGSGRVRVHAGLKQGLTSGAVLALCSADATRDDPDLRLGEVEIVDAGAGESPGRWRRGSAKDKSEVAPKAGPCTAFLLQRGEPMAPLPVSVEGDSGTATALAQGLETARLFRRVEAADASFRIARGTGQGVRGWRVLDASGRALSEPVEDSEGCLRELAAAMSTLGRAWRIRQILTGSAARGFPAEIEVSLLGEARADASRERLGEPERDARGRWRIGPGVPWCVSVANRSDVAVFASFVLVFPDGRIVVARPSGPEERIRTGGEPARCAPGAIEIPPGLEGFYGDEPVRLCCVLTPRRCDLSGLAQDAFSIGPDSMSASRGSSPELEGETWACFETEIAVR